MSPVALRIAFAALLFCRDFSNFRFCCSAFVVAPILSRCRRHATEPVAAREQNVAPADSYLSSSWTNDGRPFDVILHRRRMGNSAFFAATRSTARLRNSASDGAESGFDDGDEAEDEEGDPPPVELPDETELPLSPEELRALTTSQLKQQLRLRGLKVSGKNKEELVLRLLRATGGMSSDAAFDDDDDVGEGTETTRTGRSTRGRSSKAREFAEERGQELIDVTEFLGPEDRGRQVKTASIGGSRDNVIATDETESASSGGGSSEVWGSEARIVDDYEGRQVVVDSLSQTVVEFMGSNRTMVQAFCAASRDALTPFLAGGSRSGTTSEVAYNRTRTAAEERLHQIQAQRENAARRPVHMEDQAGLDEGDETGIYKDILHRDFSDWGKYTQTGAQLSASEVQGVLLLSDVYGAFTEDMQALAMKIAFECQPVVVMVPDLFRGDPWTGPTDGRNEKGQSYEEWRAEHSDLRVSVDIRAAAACLRERYGVSSIVVWGTCYGGGRALEAASGWLPDSGNIHDIDGSIGPPLVNPMAAIAWYPTRYNAQDLFGKNNKGSREDMDNKQRQMAVMAVFAENDDIPGATKDDAAALKRLLEEDVRVKDHMVKIFQGQVHGFAHHGISKKDDDGDDPFERFVDDEFGGAGKLSLQSGGDAEVACLLSTAFMETYSRVFLPTIGPPISLDEMEGDWGKNINMKGYRDSETRDVRKEIGDSIENFVEEPLGGYRMDPSDESQEEELKRLLKSMQDPDADNGEFAIGPDDDLSTMYAKLTASDDDFQLF